jgi:UDP-N-acetylglucosamine--N-acetylmuramyl-(pentapeptide) pyrophosphoryl-undecaprenol N-acetylglucosamine transferase
LRDKFHILIFGGSQGARSLNVAMTSNLDQLAPIADRIAILHQTGRESVDEIRSCYNRAGIQADVRDFIVEMGDAYQWADLVVCRAGAGSLAEITALGKPALVVPYPYAIGDHQAKNAAVLESQGAVKIIGEDRLKNGSLVREIHRLVDEPDLLRDMAENSRRAGRPDAARAIALNLLGTARSHL